MRYCGASDWTVAMKAACAVASSGGGGEVRVATGCPTRVKNSSWPAGAHRHSSRGDPGRRCGTRGGRWRAR